jgi:hypothetical protein
MRVALDGEFSNEATVESGVPQGKVLGTILFLYRINDLPNAVSSKVRLFADDCLLYREINNDNDQNTLQKDLQNLEKWATNWGMRVNAKKCFMLSLRKKIQGSYTRTMFVVSQSWNVLALMCRLGFWWLIYYIQEKESLVSALQPLCKRISVAGVVSWFVTFVDFPIY